MFNNYPIQKEFLDEVIGHNGLPKELYEKVCSEFENLSLEDYEKLNESAKVSFLNQGITFSVYSEENARGTERIFPFDLFPRVISNKEWDVISEGLIQRNTAINLFLKDIYNEKKILKDNIVPVEMIFSSPNFNRMMEGFIPQGGIYNHISGTDLIKHSDGKFYILEDNVRCPSGVSYVLSNREAMKKTFSHLFKQVFVKSVDNYPEQLLKTMLSVAPPVDNPNCVVLTPGAYNSAFYEHSKLAQLMGAQLVEGRDLFVEKNIIYMKTTQGPQRVDVIYRRVDDDFIDPLAFNPNSVLGVPGLMEAYKNGNVTLLNAPGTGVSDDKAIYDYVPDIIKYYLGEEPILNNVPTYHCDRDDDLKYVIDNLDKLVLKPVDQSGGYGIYIGSKCSPQELEEIKGKILADRRGYIAQPIMALSTHSTYIENEQAFEPRHVDIRAFTLLGKGTSYVLQGGLSRVALKKGSLIVNSSQGGGSKDTWIIKE